MQGYPQRNETIKIHNYKETDIILTVVFLTFSLRRTDVEHHKDYLPEILAIGAIVGFFGAYFVGSPVIFLVR